MFKRVNYFPLRLMATIVACLAIATTFEASAQSLRDRMNNAAQQLNQMVEDANQPASGGATSGGATASSAEIAATATAARTANGTAALGVVINGVTWATVNIDEPGAFADAPEASGKIYQFNRNTAWSGTERTVTGWDRNGDASARTWAKANDPSPEGWRLPTELELVKLLDEQRVDQEWTTVNNVNGVRFTDKVSGASVFFAAAGGRTAGTGNLGSAGTTGYYLTRTKSDSDLIYLQVRQEEASHDTWHISIGGFLRPVAEDGLADAQVAAEVKKVNDEIAAERRAIAQAEAAEAAEQQRIANEQRAAEAAVRREQEAAERAAADAIAAQEAAAQAATRAPLIGSWRKTDGGNPIITFNNDGIAKVDNSTGSGDTFTVSGNTLTIGAVSMTFEISGNTLVISGGGLVAGLYRGNWTKQ